MSAVTAMPHTQNWTVDDLAALPDDGFRYELVDGVLLVSAAPVPAHQRAARGIFVLLHDTAPDDVEVFFAPLDFQPTRRRSLEPDVLVVRTVDVGEKNITEPLLLAVEVLSPGTRAVDLTLKRHVYEESGVPSYWLVDPQVPSVTVLELDAGGHYIEVATAQGDTPVTVERPFPLTIVPSALLTRDPRRPD
jgi:Uma2 family endonuclease